MGTETTTPGPFAIKPGDVLADKYVVERTLGVGGMGVVVAARHLTVQHRVALKFLLPSATLGRVAAARFLREAQAATAIQSEHVVRVMDLGSLHTGVPYLVMEYLEGLDLSRLLVHKGALPSSVAVDYLLQALVAIAEAHALGIVHRDLKPSNLFLTQRSDGSPLVKVLDFGISKAMNADASRGHESLTRSGCMIGSPSYMAPEQIRSPKHVDSRADIWSLGIILHELVTGKPPFTADQVSGVLAAIVADRPSTPRGLTQALPRGLAHVILKCLEKEPRDRYSTARDLAEALAPFAPSGAQPLVARIAAITQRKGPSRVETQVVRSAPFGLRAAIATSVIAILVAAILALRLQKPDVEGPNTADTTLSTKGASHEGERALVPGERELPSQAIASAAPPPAASSARAPPPARKRRVPRSMGPESAGSGTPPRAISDIVLDRR